MHSVYAGKKDVNELYEPALEIISIGFGIPLQIVRTGGNIGDWFSDEINFELEDIINRRRKSERNKNP